MLIGCTNCIIGCPMAKLNALLSARGFTGELGCSTMYEFVCRMAILATLCEFECRRANLVALWRIRMPIGECGCPKAIMNASWPFWLHYSEFEYRLVILAALSAKLNDLFIRSHALCAKLNDLSLLLHALSAKLDGKTYYYTQRKIMVYNVLVFSHQWRSQDFQRGGGRGGARKGGRVRRFLTVHDYQHDIFCTLKCN